MVVAPGPRWWVKIGDFGLSKRRSDHEDQPLARHPGLCLSRGHRLWRQQLCDFLHLGCGCMVSEGHGVFFFLSHYAYGARSYLVIRI